MKIFYTSNQYKMENELACRHSRNLYRRRRKKQKYFSKKSLFLPKPDYAFSELVLKIKRRTILEHLRTISFVIFGGLVMLPSQAFTAGVSTLEAHRLEIGSEPVGLVAWDPSEEFLAVTSPKNDRLCVWALANKSKLWCIPKIGTFNEHDLEFSLSGAYVITRSKDAFGTDNKELSIYLIDKNTGEQSFVLGDVKPVEGSNVAAGFSQSLNGQLAVILGPATGLVAIYDESSWKLIKRVGPIKNARGGTYGARFVAIDKTSSLVSVGFSTGEIQTWDINKNRVIGSFVAYTTGLLAMTLSQSSGACLSG